MKHGIPGGKLSGTGGLKNFFKAREIERKKAEEKAARKKDKELEPKIVVVEDTTPAEINFSFTKENLDTDTEINEIENTEILDPDPIEQEDIINEAEVNVELETAEGKKKKRYKRKKKKKTIEAS